MSATGVSIICLAYNAEEYIRDAIEGFLNQKTTFPIEIIIHDDVSTDRTALIIREYEKQYPDLIFPIYQKINRFSRGISINKEFILSKIHYDYIALCDGDDYWTDPYKLQKQYDALQSHKECAFSVHLVRQVDSQSLFHKNYPVPKRNIDSGVYSSKEFLEIYGSGDFFNEVSYFFKADAYIHYQNNYPEFASSFMKNRIDDVPMICYFGALSPVYYLNEEMAVYRYMNNNSFSFLHRNQNLTKQQEFFRNNLNALQTFDRYSSFSYHEELHYVLTHTEFHYEKALGHYENLLKPEYEYEFKGKKKIFRILLTFFRNNPKLLQFLAGSFYHIKNFFHIG